MFIDIMMLLLYLNLQLIQHSINGSCTFDSFSLLCCAIIMNFDVFSHIWTPADRLSGFRENILKYTCLSIEYLFKASKMFVCALRKFLMSGMVRKDGINHELRFQDLYNFFWWSNCQTKAWEMKSTNTLNQSISASEIFHIAWW